MRKNAVRQHETGGQLLAVRRPLWIQQVVGFSTEHAPLPGLDVDHEDLAAHVVDPAAVVLLVVQATRDTDLRGVTLGGRLLVGIVWIEGSHVRDRSPVGRPVEMANGASMVGDLACLARPIDGQDEQAAARLQPIRDESDPATIGRPARFAIGVARPGQTARVRAVDSSQPDLAGATVHVFVRLCTHVGDLRPVGRDLRIARGYDVVDQRLRVQPRHQCSVGRPA